MLRGMISIVVLISCISLPVVSQARGHHYQHADHHHRIHYKSYRHHWKHDSCVRLKPGTRKYIHVC